MNWGAGGKRGRRWDIGREKIMVEAARKGGIRGKQPLPTVFPLVPV